MAVASWLDLAPPETAQGQEIGLDIDSIAVAVDDGRWMALCPQYDVSSIGDSPEQALTNMVEALRSAYTFNREQGLPFPETPTPDDDLRDYLISHQGPQYHRHIRI
ncbi:MAG TPA: hypothetical protein VKT20_03985 [Candidatus Dormibacteraeota bacterium]|nr:hypothetical protein [Candidatus Dormibacteraeota bacterium]